ncbi:hypothetical protein K504DRAFT_506543 [Pleomassaria siparia CBS 279.74]|uniref:Uncharacterized protein n=1 Tax=Pleomassaria siparia CBS 279.74 TaxID=1314801 RepID=A0A6G1JXK8_9PLEO|nr:hypothetical protein K504DRAFT_506543 [Pleomassaria siparia CBS 279.74]
MADSTPVSPPSVSVSSNPLSPVAQPPSSSLQGTAPTHETSTPAINSFAVELDSTAIEAPTDKAGPNTEDQNEGHGGLKDKVAGLAKKVLGKKSDSEEGKVEGGNVGLGEEEDINEEFLGGGERGAGKEVREKRAELLSTRAKDPGVIVDLPQDPTAEEVQAAKSVEGIITPVVLSVSEGR